VFCVDEKTAIQALDRPDPKSLKLNSTVAKIVQRITQGCELK
jgi:hypothetical protein